MTTMNIDGRKVGDGQPCFIIAEISCNHLQKKAYALRLIEEAKSAGADAVKFQTYTPDTMTIDCNSKYFQLDGTIWAGKTLYDLYKEAYTPWEWFPELKDRAKQEGVVFFSTPFDETAVDFLETLEVPAYKIASFEVNHIPLIKYAAKKKKPMIFSTGLAALDDIELAIDTIRSVGNNQIMVLKCTSAYPAPVKEANLRTIPDMKERFGVLAGLSDHTMTTTVPAVAVAVGACAVEKHFILDRKEGGFDAKFSLEPAEFRTMVNAIRETEEALGNVRYQTTEEAEGHRFIMRSIFVVKDVKKGEKLTRENIRIIRPGQGLHPKYYDEMLGKTAKKALKKGTPLERSMIE